MFLRLLVKDKNSKNKKPVELKLNFSVVFAYRQVVQNLSIKYSKLKEKVTQFPEYTDFTTRTSSK